MAGETARTQMKFLGNVFFAGVGRPDEQMQKAKCCPLLLLTPAKAAERSDASSERRRGSARDWVKKQKHCWVYAP